MADLLPNLALSRLFSSRIRHYLLFLEVTNNAELICRVTEFLDIRGVLNFLSSSAHLYSFRGIATIQIRLLKAKVDYYEKPQIQPSFQTFINFLPIKMPMVQNKLKGQRLARDHACLKKLKEEMRLSRYQIKISNKQVKNKLEGKQINSNKSLTTTNSQQSTKKQTPAQPNVSSRNNKNTENTLKSTFISNQNKEKSPQFNPYLQRFQEVEYQIARKDFQRRKMKRMQQNTEHQYSIAMQQLKKMAVEDPCCRQVLQKIQAEEIERIQRANVQKLRMKSVKLGQKQVQTLRMLQEQQQKKGVVVKQSLFRKLVTNFKGLVAKQ